MVIPPKRVTVIGAGVSGVVAAAHLKRKGIDVTVIERSNAAGGIWQAFHPQLYDERQPLEPSYQSVPVSKAGQTYTKSATEDIARLLHAPPGPCYIGLKNNVSTPLLETTLQRFPPGTEDFVFHGVLKDYIQDVTISTGVHELTRYDTDVKSVIKNDHKWNVETVTLQVDENGAIAEKTASQVSGTVTSHTTSLTSFWTFDSVVVASGHYHAPKVPETAGLAKWKQRWPQRVEHSKRYWKPVDSQGKNFFLVGGSVSAIDIARELGPHANRIYQSQRNGKFDLPASMIPENAFRIEEVVSYDVPTPDRSFTLQHDEAIPTTVTLTSGRKICDIYQVILCTGYHLTLPFLPQMHSDDTPVDQANETVLVTDGSQFHNLHKDIFYIPDPTLIFIGVPFLTANFALFEFQAMAATNVLSGQAKLPSTRDMRAEYDARVKSKGHGKALHSLRDREVEYVDELMAWVNGDLERTGRTTLGRHTQRWHAAKERQAQQVKALFAKPSIERSVEVTCL